MTGKFLVFRIIADEVGAALQAADDEAADLRRRIHALPPDDSDADAPAIRAALEGKLVNVLITDTVSAEQLLNWKAAKVRGGAK